MVEGEAKEGSEKRMQPTVQLDEAKKIIAQRGQRKYSRLSI
jgi:hypothetical protein